MKTIKDQNITKPKKYTYFIGIDVSKNKLDYAVMRGNDLLFHREAKNEPAVILDFINELKDFPGFTIRKALFCMENTGIYCNHLIRSLSRLKGNIHVGHALHIKRSLGLVRGKNDKIDAIRIVRYSWKNRDELRLFGEKRLVITKLSALNSLRNRLTRVGVMVKTPLKEQSAFIDGVLQAEILAGCELTDAAVKSDLKNLEDTIKRLINSDVQVKRLIQIITSVPGVGLVTALQVLISTNEFKDISDPKKFACYAGVAPFKSESGKETGLVKAKVSKAANKKVKSLLHICAVRAIQHDENLRAYYERKTTLEKKSKMLTINAVRNKLILRIFACVRQDQCYCSDHVPDRFQLTNHTPPPEVPDAC